MSYTQFLELQRSGTLPLLGYLKTRFRKCSGISFIDSTCIAVCDNHRITYHRVFKDFARRGKTSVGWFYGFKLHFVVSDTGDLINATFTTGNVDDRNPVPKLSKKLFGKLFGDRGYVSQKLFKQLFDLGLQFVTKIKKNMKNKLMSMFDKILLRKRAVIESVIDQLKPSLNIRDYDLSVVPAFAI